MRTNQDIQVWVSSRGTCSWLTGWRRGMGCCCLPILDFLVRGIVPLCQFHTSLWCYLAGHWGPIHSLLQKKGSPEKVCQECGSAKDVFYPNLEVWQALGRTTSTSLHLYFLYPPITWFCRALTKKNLLQRQVGSNLNSPVNPRRLQKQRLEKAKQKEVKERHFLQLYRLISSILLNWRRVEER